MISLAALAAEEAHAAGAGQSVGLLQDPSLWVLIAFIIVIVIFARARLHKMAVSSLDKRAQTIADEINEARKLREEAQELLAQYQRRQREAENEAAAIIDQAKADAKRMASEARDKINDQIERRNKGMEEKIARAEAQAVSEIREKTVDLAIEIARDIIRNRMDSGAQSAYIDKAISELRGKLN